MPMTVCKPGCQLPTSMLLYTCTCGQLYRPAALLHPPSCTTCMLCANFAASASSMWSSVPDNVLAKAYTASLVGSNPIIPTPLPQHTRKNVRQQIQAANRARQDRQIAYQLVCKAWHQAAGKLTCCVWSHCLICWSVSSHASSMGALARQPSVHFTLQPDSTLTMQTYATSL